MSADSTPVVSACAHRRRAMSTQGQVKWFDPKKGFGFILGPSGQDVVVHYSQIQGDGFRSLKDGEMVEYELIEAEKGLQARTVVRKTTGNYRAAAPHPVTRPSVA